MKFSDIAGNESVKQRLRDMVASDRIPHALLLEGPEGIGNWQWQELLPNTFIVRTRRLTENRVECAMPVCSIRHSIMPTCFLFILYSKVQVRETIIVMIILKNGVSF